MEEPRIEPTPETPEVVPENGEDQLTWKRFLVDLLETVVLSVILFLVINTLSARVRVDGYSMLPTLQNGEFVLVNRIAYWNGLPERGDIVVFEYSPTQDLIKRVVALPGDTVKAEFGQIYVNGIALSEPYIAAAPDYIGEWRVPEGHIFVLGDNRNDSSDSHNWGPLALEKVIGQAILIYWPPEDWSLITHADLMSGAQ